MAKTNSLTHYGVLGMHWGVRKDIEAKYSSDHKAYAEIRKKKIRDMTDDELITVMKRAKLVSQYKHSNFPKPKKNIRELTNDELKLVIDKTELYKIGYRYGMKRMSEVHAMDKSQVDTALKRARLEKAYKDIKFDEFLGLNRTIKYLISDEKTSAEQAKVKRNRDKEDAARVYKIIT